MDPPKSDVYTSSPYAVDNATCDIQDSPAPIWMAYCLFTEYQICVLLWAAVPCYVFHLLVRGKEFAQAGIVRQMKMYTAIFLATLTVIQLVRQLPWSNSPSDGQNKSDMDWTQVSIYGYNGNLASFLLSMVYLLGILVELVLSCVTDGVQKQNAPDRGQSVHPEESASLISRLFMNWVTGYIRKGYSQTLQEADVPELRHQDRCQTIYPHFSNAWKQEKHKGHNIHLLERLKEWKRLVCQHKFINSTESSSKAEAKKERKPSLLHTLIKAYGLKYVIVQSLNCIFDLSQFIYPLLLGALMKHIGNRATEPAWKGYAIVIAMFLTNSGIYTLHIRFQQTNQKLFLHMKTALRMAVFRKAFTATNESRRDKTIGELVTLINDDVQKLISSSISVYSIVVTPIQVCLALYMLYCELGMGAFVGLAIMLSLIPFNSWVGKKVLALEEDMTKVKDERIKVMNEILNGIKVLKLYAWEKLFIEKVTEIRKREVALYKWIKFCHACIDMMFRCIPLLVRLAGFIVFIVLGGHLDPAKAFVTVSLINILNAPFGFMALIIPEYLQALISLKRLNDFLTKADISNDIVTMDSQADSAICIQDGTFTWDTSADKTTLTNVNLRIRQGELVAVVGVVGAGKSSLLSAILGEMEKLEGKVTVQSKLAYVSQESWIQNATLKDNILFGSEFEAESYHQVIKACALTDDLKILAAGDNTEIGEKGVNLSGGQKQRVSLARAAYSGADILLLDDPLSAVDAHVGKHIFNKVIGHSGILKDKTRVLVTHGIHWLPFVDNIIVMKDGQISECGSYKQLLTHNGAFAQFLKDIFAHETVESCSEVQQIKKTIFTRLISLSDEVGTQDDRVVLDDELDCAIDTEQDISSPSNDRDDDDDHDKQTNQDGDIRTGKIIDDEDAEHGSVSLEVYKGYARAVGFGHILMFALLFLVMLFFRDFKGWWLGKWTEDPLLADTSLQNTSTYQSTSWQYISVYSLCAGLEVLTVFIFIIVLQNRTYEAASQLHSQLLTNVMRLPMAFFDTTPTGRIITRFSKDVSSVDRLGGCLDGYIRCLGNIIVNLMMVMFFAPRIIFFIFIISLIYMYMQRLHIGSARQVRRWSSKHSSPIYAFIKEAISGTTTVRAFRAQNRFITKLEAITEKHMKFEWMARCLQRWFSMRITFLSQLIALAAGLIVLWDLNISPSMAGLVLMYSSGFVHCLAEFVYHSTFTEQELVSLERVIEYTIRPTEASWKISDSAPLEEWPQNGQISMDDFKIRYREGLDLVLKGVTLNIQSGEKIGIVGRTGAGKSSLTVALFRLVEAASGRILIDNHQIDSMGLHDLRSKITILPQDPIIFGGSLRMNLDPFNKKSNDELWESLKHSHLQTFVESLPGKLDYDCGEGGQNLSGGQRQLVCLARTLLRKTKILVLDEATAAVDMETDELIQKTICCEFKDCTVLTIAHRLNTIMDYDRVLVMDQGLVKEFDSPKNLLADPSSLFYSLAKDANQVS